MFSLARRPLGLLSLTALLACAGVAQADEGYSVSVKAGSVEVKTKAGWHINKEYPWKLIAGGKKITKGAFELTEHSAKVAAPKGEAKLKGAVCLGESQCRPFSAVVSVP